MWVVFLCGMSVFVIVFFLNFNDLVEMLLIGILFVYIVVFLVVLLERYRLLEELEFDS